MSRPKSKLTKILRANARRESRRKTLVQRNRRPGETDEMMEARMKRDLFGFVDMMSEREVEERLLAATEESKKEETEDGVREDSGASSVQPTDGLPTSGDAGDDS